LAVRWGAARALGRLGTAAIPAVPALTKILKDPSVQARWAAAKSLWAIGPAAAAAVPALIESLGDQSWVVRWSAARALGAIGAGERLDPAVAALAGALRDPDSRGCEAAGFALEALGPAAAAALPALGRAATGDAVGDAGAEQACAVIDVVPNAEAIMMQSGWTVRWAAVRALGVVGRGRA